MAACLFKAVVSASSKLQVNPYSIFHTFRFEFTYFNLDYSDKQSSDLNKYVIGTIPIFRQNFLQIEYSKNILNHNIWYIRYHYKSILNNAAEPPLKNL